MLTGLLEANAAKLVQLALLIAAAVLSCRAEEEVAGGGVATVSMVIEWQCTAPGPVYINFDPHAPGQGPDALTTRSFRETATSPGQWMQGIAAIAVNAPLGERLPVVVRGNNVTRYRIHFRAEPKHQVNVRTFRRPPVSAPVDTSDWKETYVFESTEYFHTWEDYWDGDNHVFSDKGAEILVLDREEKGSLAGKASDPTNGNTKMRFSLGFLANGKSAGYLSLHASFGRVGRLFLSTVGNNNMEIRDAQAGSPPNTVQVFQKQLINGPAPGTYCENMGSVLQYLAPQALVQVEDLGCSLTISYFDPANKGSLSGGIFTPTAPAYVSYLCALTNYESGGFMTVTRTEGSDTRTASMTVDISTDGTETWTWASTGFAKNLVSSGGPEWTFEENGASQVAKRFNVEPYRFDTLLEIVEAAGPSNPADPSVGYRTNFAYYESLAEAGWGNFRRQRTIHRPDGSWEYMRYKDEFEEAGLISKIARPYGNTTLPSSFPAPEDSGFRIVEFSYENDWDGERRLPGEVLESIHGTPVARTRSSYSSSSLNGSDVWITTIKQYPDPANTSDSAAIISTLKTYQGASVDPLLQDQPVSVAAPDGSKTTYLYQRGAYDETTNSFTPGTAGAWYRIISFLGSSTPVAGGTALTNYGGSDLDVVYLIPGVSSAECSIRDPRAFTTRSEKWVFSASTWNTIEWASMKYDVAGNLVRRETNDGRLYEAEFTDINGSSEVRNDIVFSNAGTRTGRKQFEKDEQGSVTKFFYDTRGRVAETRRLEVLPTAQEPQGMCRMRTQFGYDDENRVTSKRVGEEGAEQIVEERAFDLSGRKTRDLASGLETTISYIRVAGKVAQTVTTKPGGSTLVQTRNADGTVQSNTGTAVVGEYHTYEISNSRETETVRKGSSTSARWVKTWKDGLGRAIVQQSATHTGPAMEVTSTYSLSGQLGRTQTAGVAATRYRYDPLGRLEEKFVDLDDDGVIDENEKRERIVTDIRHRNSDSDWWEYSETLSYDDGSSAGTTASRSWKRKTGFTSVAVPPSPYLATPGTVVAESFMEDALGNATRSVFCVDRGHAISSWIQVAPTASQSEVARSRNGLTWRTASAAGVAAVYTFDALDRLSVISDRTRTATYLGPNYSYIAGGNRVESRWDNSGILVVRYEYDAAGRVRLEERPTIDYPSPGTPAAYNPTALSKACYHYNTRGQKTHVWGDTVYPVKYGYDAVFGDLISETTYRTFPAWSAAWPAPDSDPGFWPTGGDTVVLGYEAETGLLSSRTDPTNHAVTYTYNRRGQLATRTWARGVVTTYSYYEANGEATGELKTVSYSDGTPTVSFIYDRMGRSRLVRDASGSRTFTYRAADLLPDEEQIGRDGTQTDASILGAGLLLRESYGATGNAPLMPNGVDLVEGSSVRFGYRIDLHPTTGRLSSVSSEAGVFTIGYAPGSNLLSQIAGANSWEQRREYEPNRNVLTSISTWVGSAAPDVVASYDYLSDARERRFQLNQSGQIFNDYLNPGEALISQWSYNGNSEVTEARCRVAPPGTPNVGAEVPGRSFGWHYDPIGNRTQERANGAILAYVANGNNQYVARAVLPTIPASGITAAGAAVAVDGIVVGPEGRMKNFFYRAVPKTTGGLQNVSISASVGGKTAASDFGLWARPPAGEGFWHDDDGNLTGDSLWTYVYDGENRLVEGFSKFADTTGQKVAVTFVYDFRGRRVSKRVRDYTGTAPGSVTFGATRAHRLFVFRGWTLVAEFLASTSTGARQALARTFTWGPDLSGTIEGAGGVGGLLAIKDERPQWNGVYRTGFDGNGNLTVLISTAGNAMAAAYEYDAYGNPLRANGPYAGENPFRFSTKFCDTEIGLVNFGFRYYAPSLGRFVNRDPLNERGAWALYRTVRRVSDNGFSAQASVGGGTLLKEWEQKQDALLGNASLAHSTSGVELGGRSNSALSGLRESQKKYFTANATPQGNQGGSSAGLERPNAPNGPPTSPGIGNRNANLYLFVGNNPINAYDPLGLSQAQTPEEIAAEKFINFLQSLPPNVQQLIYATFFGPGAGQPVATANDANGNKLDFYKEKNISFGTYADGTLTKIKQFEGPATAAGPVTKKDADALEKQGADVHTGTDGKDYRYYTLDANGNAVPSAERPHVQGELVGNANRIDNNGNNVPRAMGVDLHDHPPLITARPGLSQPDRTVLSDRSVALSGPAFPVNGGAFDHYQKTFYGRWDSVEFSVPFADVKKALGGP